MVDITTNKHALAFPSKMIAGFGGAHIYNITLAKNHDNGELVLRGGWRAFDEYDEASGAVEFEGVIRGASAEGGFYIEATADTEALFVYNTPINPYGAGEFKDDKLVFNAKGDTVKAYSIRKGDIFSVTEEIIEGTPVAGKTVTFANGKYVVA